MNAQENPEEPINHSSFRSANFGEGSAISQREKKKTAIRSFIAILESNRILILTISWVIAVIVDPLFFYLPIIDEKNKCIGMDTKLRNVALILRSLTDIGFIARSMHKIGDAVRKVRKDLVNLPKTKEKKTDGKPNRDERSKFAKAVARKLSWHSIVIDFFAVLPIPQLDHDIDHFWDMVATSTMEIRSTIFFHTLSSSSSTSSYFWMPFYLQQVSNSVPHAASPFKDLGHGKRMER